MSNDNSGGIALVLLYGYLLISQIAGIIFYFKEIKEADSILYMIFIAPFIAEVKGLLFPFFI